MGNINNKLGIKSAVSEPEIQALQSLCRDRDVVEIGSLLGYSTIMIARVAKHVLAIDPHDGYPYYNPTPTLQEFLRNIERWGVAGVITPIVQTADRVLSHLRPADVAFVDCTGLYRDTRFCLDHVKAKVLACHDFGRRGCDGATRAVEDYVRQHNKQLSVIDTLAIIQ